MTGGLHGRTIIVVDDEIDLREILEEELRDQSATVLSFESGDKMLAFLTTADPPVIPDAIVTDHRMRGQSGVEAVSKLTQNFLERGFPKPLCLLITGYADIPPEASAQAGIDFSLAKPLDLMMVVDLLRTHLERRTS